MAGLCEMCIRDSPYTIHHYLYGTTVKVAEDTTGTDAFGTNVMVTPATKFLAGFEKACAIDLAGRDVFQAVQMLSLIHI